MHSISTCNVAEHRGKNWLKAAARVDSAGALHFDNQWHAVYVHHWADQTPEALLTSVRYMPMNGTW